MNVQQEVADFVEREILFGDKSRVPGPNDPLLGAGGVVDSVGLHQLISFVEEKFGFQVGDMEIVPENFASINALSTYINSKKNGKM